MGVEDIQSFQLHQKTSDNICMQWLSPKQTDKKDAPETLTMHESLELPRVTCLRRRETKQRRINHGVTIFIYILVEGIQSRETTFITRPCFVQSARKSDETPYHGTPYTVHASLLFGASTTHLYIYSVVLRLPFPQNKGSKCSKKCHPSSNNSPAI